MEKPLRRAPTTEKEKMTATMKRERPIHDALERKIVRQIADAYAAKERKILERRNHPSPTGNPPPIDNEKDRGNKKPV